mmetsp:Transcript_8134/g.17696  ORF Transcript_8134/g.17696 Transcript_8134/m.17696 type:complete len:342 (+) Transcript_8134:36-1061(+)|eukprot:CAMPEP_0204255782 /NCGR_PEP_ID=MMETSP0468-20130131/3410_1 /ASSEMBLY_ACC=CAM_ASM_000383 /TAXON_ID=2969 /ORGANISM="Oxyrrhis marina" /LENGTH=341 /DNA_ID=CAMNT_0051229691 /DNA_START=29 /DNA_END=1054 /DNA_ORIENTATION=+
MFRIGQVFGPLATRRLSVAPVPLWTRGFASIPATLVKQLRDRTGASMGKCREALEHEELDLEKAHEWLRKKGIKKAEGRLNRDAGEGIVAVAQSADRAVIVELQCETDFVARAELFLDCTDAIAKMVVNEGSGKDLEALGAVGLPAIGSLAAAPAKEVLLELSSVLGESILLKRVAQMERPENGVVSSYVHNASRPGIGRMAALVALRAHPSVKDEAAIAEAARGLARQVVATKPNYVKVEDIPQEVLDSESQILLAAQRAEREASGKTLDDATAQKILQGKLNKMYQEEVLMKQEFLRPGDDAKPPTVEKYLAEVAGQVGVDKLTVEAATLVGVGIDSSL